MYNIITKKKYELVSRIENVLFPQYTIQTYIYNRFQFHSNNDIECETNMEYGNDMRLNSISLFLLNREENIAGKRRWEEEEHSVVAMCSNIK